MKWQLEDLLAFLAVAESGKVGLAARRLHRSQPTLSGRLQRLQESIGEPLYQRQGRQLVLTPSGQSLLPLLRRLREDLAEIDDWAQRRQRLQEGSIRIAASTTVANYFLMDHLARFRAQYPAIELRLKTGSFEIAEMDWNDWDLLFTEESIARERIPGHIQQEPWREDELVAILPRTHPWVLGGRREVSWEEVLQEPIVWREPHSGIRKRVEQTLRERGLKPSYTVEVTGVEGLREAVAAGLGIGFASVEALDKVRWPLASLRLDPPHGLFWTLYVLHPAPDCCSAALRALLSLLRRPAAATQEDSSRIQAP
ncbi:MAG: LysR family transcriptional regulator [Acidithiobacillus sp.]|nr:LysR family transcriptional regulator [Acidithiobacillus sp.]